MRILIVGPDKIFSIENFYVKYLEEAGVEIVRFSSQNLFYDYYQKSLLNKFMFRLGLSGIYSRINSQFTELISKKVPDAIWIFKGMEILPGSLRWARVRKIKLVNYNPDNPFLFSGRGSGNSNITKSINLYDLHFTYNKSIQNQLEKEYHARTAFLPFGFDISGELYKVCEEQAEVHGVCFLGNPDKNRSEFILSLAEQGIGISIYGHGWNKFVNHPRVRVYDAVYGEDQWKVLRKYRVQLNLMRIHNEDSHNMRTFEVPGIGGIMLAPDTPEHRVFFEDGKEIFLFSDVSDCIERIQFILGLSIEAAGEVRKAARLRSLNSGYSYKNRAAAALKEIENLSIE